MARFKTFSPKQAEVFRFMAEPYEALICDGSVRSGKTITQAIAFVEWAMGNFDGESLGICGKTVMSAERNIIAPLMGITSLRRRYHMHYSRGVSLLTVRRGDRTNYFYVFGGKDESSYMLIQGITLAGVMMDEVALMPQSFVEQAIARTLSVADAKLWFNCNPENPSHWFHEEWILKPDEHNAKYLHFTMDDNPSLTSAALERAKRSFSGVFYDRYVRGLWVAAEGVIYNAFATDKEPYKTEQPHSGDLQAVNVGVDFGGGESGHAFVAVGIRRGHQGIVALASERHLRSEQTVEIDPVMLGDLFVDFCRRIVETYGTIRAVYCDSAEQTLIAGLRASARKGGLAWMASSIQNALKTTINDRIRATTRLMATGRFEYVPGPCKTLETALSDAVWNPKNRIEDERLDDGTSDIDSLDAFEYAFEREISQLVGAL